MGLMADMGENINIFKVFMVKPKLRGRLWRRVTWGIVYYWVGLCVSECGLVVGCCDGGNEHAVFIKLGNLLNGLEIW